ncbi:MAG TPA: metallophosphoesterase family protein [Trueperaceae bacterium]|nr:metallophosphoesterase family protein [Trueperaceae bacterium]
MDLGPAGSVALISDIHGNLVAFDAVLADLDAVRPDGVVCLGDVAATGPRPHEVLLRLRGLRWPVLLGNADAWLLDPREPPPEEAADRFLQEVRDLDRWCAGRLDKDDRAYLRSLPKTLEVDLGESGPLLCFHGSPRSFNELLVATTPPEELDVALHGTSAPVLAGGHSHQPLLRRHRDRLLLNPGSVGVPYERVGGDRITRTPPWAEYLLLRWDGAALDVTWRRVPVDNDAVIADYRRSGMPHVDTFTAGRRG